MLNWVSTPVNDMIADSILSIVLSINLNPTNYQTGLHSSSSPINELVVPKSSEEKEQEKFEAVEKCLKEHYSVVSNHEDRTIGIILDKDKKEKEKDKDKEKEKIAVVYDWKTNVHNSFRFANAPVDSRRRRGNISRKGAWTGVVCHRCRFRPSPPLS